MMHGQHWRLLALLADGSRHHIGELGRQLGMKPQQINGIWQQVPPHIRGLLRQQDGLWHLVRPLAVFEQSALQQAVGGWRVRLVHECTSSNDLLIADIKKCPETADRLVYVAHQQTNGRGRQGRDWHSRLGECIMFSVGRRFERSQAELGALAPVSALACCRALRKLGVPAQIKWPNDLVVGTDKLGGILIETVRSGGATFAVIGIGLNFVLPKEVEQAASIQAAFQTAINQRISATQVLSAVWQALDEALNTFEAGGFAPMVGEYEAYHRDQNRLVRLLRNGALEDEGTALGVTKTGALKLGTGKGVREVVSGEISLRPSEKPCVPAPSHSARYLLLDGGNSKLKWAWVENGQILSVNRAPYRDLQALAEEWRAQGGDMVALIGCAVCGEVKKALVAEQVDRAITWLPSMAQALGIRNHYRNPAEHGSDRWFNALGSRRFTDHACVVVSCGTAVTVDALTADNHYLGGTIMPGFHLMKEAMALKTANLNRPIGKVYPFPTTTANALASGMMDAVCGSVMLMHGRLVEKSGGAAPVDVVLTGGGAAKVAQALPTSFTLDNTVKIVDNLVIYGLLNWIEQA